MKKMFPGHRFAAIFAGVAALCLIASGAWAQTEMPSQVSLQYTGTFMKNATGNGITDKATRAGGFQVNYTYMFSRLTGVEGAYGWTRNTQNYSGDFGTAGVQSNMHEMTGALVFRPSVHVLRVRPYALAGGGALRFSPTNNPGNFIGSLPQTKAAFVYGGGADLDISHHLGIRADYRGFLTKTPDFTLSSLTVGAATHFAQPSVGVLFRF